jgi:hypothetical protein
MESEYNEWKKDDLIGTFETKADKLLSNKTRLIPKKKQKPSLLFELRNKLNLFIFIYIDLFYFY